MAIKHGTTSITTASGTEHPVQVEGAPGTKEHKISFLDACEFYTTDWPAFENDVRELLGLPKHRTRKKAENGAGK